MQRVRLQNVSPGAALDANKILQKKGTSMTLSNFSYESSPLKPGQLFGNHFKIILRDVVAPRNVVDSAMSALASRGFPKFYGCQGFSWFGDVSHDPAFAILSRNWLAFAFRFLNFTDQPMTLRQLLQREHKFPHAIQDHYGKRAVKRLRNLNILPVDLDVEPFLDAPNLYNTDLRQYDNSTRIQLVLGAIEEAFFDLDGDGRRMIAQRLGSYLWNQVFSLRLHHFGGTEVLPGDLVIPKEFHRLSRQVAEEERQQRTVGGLAPTASASPFSSLTTVTAENMHLYSIEDVVHPGFSFDGRLLPNNHVANFYHDVCGKHHLNWGSHLAKQGIRDFFRTSSADCSQTDWIFVQICHE